jgi:hypothetical protein
VGVFPLFLLPYFPLISAVNRLFHGSSHNSCLYSRLLEYKMGRRVFSGLCPDLRPRGPPSVTRISLCQSNSGVINEALHGTLLLV